MEDVSKLVLKVESKQVVTARKNLKDFYLQAFKAESAADKLGTSTNKAGGSFKGLGSFVNPTTLALAGLTAGAAGLNKVFRETAALQDYQAQLKTATGSTEEARVAFENLEEFAAKTPYALNQSVEAFIKLKNLGLEPSERALMSYGNTASAMGKDLSQFIEAVADASTSEFERLKEFGIKARKNGDQVSFTFKGMTKTIGNNSEEIQSYLMQLGETDFAGAMTDRMDTLNGAASNLEDAWDKLFRTMGDGTPVGEALKDAFQAGAAVLSKAADAAKRLFNFYDKIVTTAAAYMELSGEERDAYLKKADAIRRGVDQISKESQEREKLKKIEQQAQAGREAMAKAEEEIRRKNLTGMEKYKTLLLELEQVDKRLKEGTTKNIGADQKRYQKLREEIIKLNFEYEKSLVNKEDEKSNESLRNRISLEKFLAKEKINGLVEERNYKEAIEILDTRYFELHNKIHDAKSTATEKEIQEYERLGQEIERIYSLESDYNQSLIDLKNERLEQEKQYADEQRKLAERKIQSQKKEFDSLKDSLRTEEEAIEESYKNRLEIILRNTEEGTTERLDLIERLERERSEKIKSIMDSRNKSIEESNNEIKELTNNAFDEMGNSILSFAKTGEFSVKSMADSIIDQIQRMVVEMSIITPLKNAFSTQTPGINAGGSGGGIWGTIFQAGASAFAANHYGGIAGQTTMTRNVSPSAFSGATRYHTGGIAGMRPDEVPTILQRGEEVLTKDDPRHRYNGSSGGGGTTVNIINESGGQVETQQRQNGNESIVDVIIKQAESFIGTNLSNGRGIGPIIERKYNLSPTLGT